MSFEKYKTTIIYFIILFLSLITGLYLIESYLTFWQGSTISKNVKIYKELTGNEYDTRPKIQVYKDLKKNSKEIALRVTPMTFIQEERSIYPLSGISLSDTISCNENGYFSIFKSDRHGFNNPDAEWDKKEIEFLLVGDSFALGSCVNRPYDIASVLRKISNKSVLNLGYAANGPLLEYATLREYLNPKIKKVIWIYYEFNDLLDLNNELKSSFLRNYLDNKSFSQNLKNKQSLINKELLNYTEKAVSKYEKRKKYENNFSYRLLSFIKFSNLRKNITNILRDQPEPQEEFVKILKQAKELVEKNNSKLYFVYLPGYYKYKINYWDKNYFKIKKIVNKLGIPFIDIHTEVFTKEKEPLSLFPFRNFGHYNVEGYFKVAKAINRLSKWS